MEALDSVAHRYGVLPSVVLGEEHPMKAFAINLWAHNYGIGRENKQGWLARVFGGNRGRR